MRAAVVRPPYSSADVQEMVTGAACSVVPESHRMITINSEQFEKICDFVWNERASILRGRGGLSGEATLVRAVFWRLCKAGIRTKGCADNDGSKPALDAYQLIVGRMLKMNASPAFDSEPILKELVERYQHEAANEN